VKEPGPVEASRAEAADRPAWLTPVLGVSVVALAASMLWLALNPAPHNGGDNAGYLTLAHSLLESGDYVDRWHVSEPAHTKYPPLYPLVLAGAMALGAGTWGAFKVLSLIFVVASAAVVYLWVAERRSPWGAAAVALMIAISPAFVWASSWILSDPLFVFLTLFALWALERGEARREGEEARPVWTVLGAAAAILSTFARTAGLPLILAVGLYWAFRRRWRALAGFGIGFAVPSLLWWLRARGVGDVQYVSEFWMVDPYQPELGRAGFGDLVARVWQNAQGYALEHIPAGLTSYPAGFLSVIGLLLFVLASAGWLARSRRKLGVTEIFAPVYLGLILLWPVVWSGDRFALPLYPLVLFFAWEGLDLALGRVGRWAPTLAAAALASVLSIPALQGWSRSVEQAEACRAAVASNGPFACYHSGYLEFVAASRWLGENAVDGAAVFVRKPRIFHVLSGLRSRTYPFTQDAAQFLREAEALGVGYVILDRVDRLGLTYVGSVVSQRPDRFCSLVGFGSETGPRTEVLGLMAEPPAGVSRSGEGATAGIGMCGPEWVTKQPRGLPPYSASALPLLSLPSP
jgi:4-amino-4-deoxy-L-arabinose transferase-like glycosyltransferase